MFWNLVTINILVLWEKKRLEKPWRFCRPIRLNFKSQTSWNVFVHKTKLFGSLKNNILYTVFWMTWLTLIQPLAAYDLTSHQLPNTYVSHAFAMLSWNQARYWSNLRMVFARFNTSLGIYSHWKVSQRVVIKDSTLWILSCSQFLNTWVYLMLGVRWKICHCRISISFLKPLRFFVFFSHLTWISQFMYFIFQRECA